MGSWNGTCGISNLPIQNGDKVLLFVLAKSKALRTLGGGFSYPTDVYTPVGIPVHGSYNDYGTHLALCSTIQDVCAKRDLQNAEQ